MSNKFIVVEKDEWEHATTETKLWMIFKTLQNIDERIRALEKKSLIDKTYSAIGGIVGGMLAAIGIKIGGG